MEEKHFLERHFKDGKVEFNSIPEERWKELKAAVARSGGRAIVLVHPFFRFRTDEIKGNAESIVINDKKRYFKVISGLIAKATVPIIFLEEAFSLEDPKMQEIYCRMKPTIFFIPTIGGDPAILTKKGKNILKDKKDMRLKVLSSRLEWAGVKGVLIGGRQVAIGEGKHSKTRKLEESWLIPILEKTGIRYKYLENPLVQGCAGITYKELIRTGKFRKIRWVPNAILTVDTQIPKARPYALPRKFQRRQKRISAR